MMKKTVTARIRARLAGVCSSCLVITMEKGNKETQKGFKGLQGRCHQNYQACHYIHDYRLGEPGPTNTLREIRKRRPDSTAQEHKWNGRVGYK